MFDTKVFILSEATTLPIVPQPLPFKRKSLLIFITVSSLNDSQLSFKIK